MLVFAHKMFMIRIWMHILYHKIHIMFVLYRKVDKFILDIIWIEVWMGVKMILAYFVGGGIYVKIK